MLNSKRRVERVEKGKQNDWMWRENLLYTPNSYTQLNGSHRQSSHHTSLAMNGPIEVLLLSGTRVNTTKGSQTGVIFIAYTNLDSPQHGRILVKKLLI